MQVLKQVSLLAVALLLVVVATAQSKITATVDFATVGVNDIITYTLDVSNTQSRNITRPAFADFRVVSGPVSSSQTTVINGVMTSVSTISYRLRPLKTGTLTIEEAILIDAGTTYKTKPIAIRVSTSSQSSDENLFGEIEVNKKTVYEGEQILAKYYIYNRYTNFNLEDYNFRSSPGFTVEDIPLYYFEFDNSYYTINSMKYRRGTLKQEVLFAQLSGNVEIKPFSFSGTVGRWSAANNKYFTVTSKATKIEVKPLPDNAPTTFTGGVGEFALEMSIDKRTIKTNDAITMVITINGSGNLQFIDEPTIELPTDFESYDPNVTNNVLVDEVNGMNGSRSFEFLVIPRKEGEYMLAPFKFTYFNPEKEQYVTQTTDSVKISVLHNPNLDTDHYVQPEEDSLANTETVDSFAVALDDDIRPLKTEAQLKENNPVSSTGSMIHWVGLGIPIGIFVIAWMLRARNEEKEKDGTKRVTLADRAPKSSPHLAGKIANQYLANARKQIREGDTNAFYDSLYKGMNHYICEKFSIPPALLTRDTMQQAFGKAEIPEALQQQVFGLLEQCEMARYAPLGSSPKETVIEEASTLIQTLENQVK